jgi:hypothetical protein
VVEQLGMAALDVGRLDIAKVCHLIYVLSARNLLGMTQTAWKALSDRIGSDSPRVILLQGLIMEATEPLDVVLRFYESEASKNQHNPVCIFGSEYIVVF